MITKAQLLCKNIVLKVVQSMKRFPEAIFFYCATTLILIYMNHIAYNKATFDFLTRIAMILALGAVVFLCIRTFLERKHPVAIKTTIAIYASAIIGLFIYFFLLLDELNTVSVTRYTALSLSLYLLFTFIPYFRKKGSYELYVITLFTRFFITYLYSIVLFLGLAAIIYTIDTLFGVNIDGSLYYDIWLIVACAFAPAYFLAEIPGQQDSLYVENYSKVLTILMLYIVMPIIIIYTAVLYAFFVKILLSGEWPGGIVANLVLWYSIISTVVLFFIYPLRSKDNLVKHFISLFPKYINIPLIMMFITLGIRINAYGITENRYFVLVAGLWVSGCMIYYIISKNITNIALSVSLALIMTLSVIGPWSSYSVSKYSQRARFEKILKENQMLAQDGSIIPSNALSSDEKETLTSILYYFEKNHELSELGLLPVDFQLEDTPKVLGFEPYMHGDYKYFGLHIGKGQVLIDINDYDFFYDIYPYRNGKDTDEGELDISYREREHYLKISSKAETVYEKNVADIAREIIDKNKGREELDVNEMLYTDENENIKVLYVFNHINGREENESVIVEYIDFKLFIKIK